MKFLKIISLMCLVLFCGTIMFGCGNPEEDKFYEQTNIEFNKFVETVCENEKYKNGIIYGDNINLIINNIENNINYQIEKPELYTELKDVYDKIFIMSFNSLSQFKGVFANVPNDLSNNTKKEFQDFEKNIQNAIEKLEQFDNQVSILDNGITGVSAEEAQTSISIQRLKEFKRQYIDLSQTFILLSEDLLHLCTQYIYPQYQAFKYGEIYENLTETQLINQKTIANLKSAINTLTPAINYLNKFNGEYEKLDSDKFFVIIDYYNNLNFSNQTSTTVQELDIWLNTYNAYMNELDCFNTSLENIDLLEFVDYYNCNIDEYKKDYPENYAYLNKIFTFTSESIETLYNAVRLLCE